MTAPDRHPAASPHPTMAQRVADGWRPSHRARLSSAQLALLRVEAADVAGRAVGHVFSGRRADNVEAHLSRGDLSALLLAAYEAGYCTGVGELPLAVPDDAEVPRAWEVGDTCHVRGEGDEVLRVDLVEERTAVLHKLDGRLHGREDLRKMTLVALRPQPPRLGDDRG